MRKIFFGLLFVQSQRYKEDFLKIRKQNGLSVDGYQDYAYTMESLEIECSADRQRSLETADYDVNDRKISESFPISGWRHLSEDSIAASIAAPLCRQHAVSNTWCGIIRNIKIMMKIRSSYSSLQSSA